MNAKEYMYTCLAEEAGEVATEALAVQKSICKLLRFGEVSEFSSNRISNIDDLSRELNDLIACVELLQEAGISFPHLYDKDAIEAKKTKVRRYLRENYRKNLSASNLIPEVTNV